MLGVWHTSSLAFRHLPPNSARIGYATEGALFISAQLSTDEVSAHTPSIAFLQIPSIALWHLPPNSARFSYATEGALFISAQLSSDAVSRMSRWKTDDCLNPVNNLIPFSLWRRLGRS